MSENKATSSWLVKTKDALKEISFGKYPGSLYLKGRLQYSTVLGGIVTLALVILLLTFAAVQINKAIMI